MLNSWWIRFPRSVLPACYNSLGQALGRLCRRTAPDEQVGPAGGQPRQTLPHYDLLYEAITTTLALTGEVQPLDLVQEMVHRFPEPRSSSAWRDVFRAWRAEETQIWRCYLLNTVIADLGSSTASNGLVPVAEAISRGLLVQADEFPVEMDVD